MSENYKINMRKYGVTLMPFDKTFYNYGNRRNYGVTLMPFDKTFYNYGKGFNINSNISTRWDSMVLIPRGGSCSPKFTVSVSVYVYVESTDFVLFVRINIHICNCCDRLIVDVSYIDNNHVCDNYTMDETSFE